MPTAAIVLGMAIFGLPIMGACSRNDYQAPAPAESLTPSPSKQLDPSAKPPVATVGGKDSCGAALVTGFVGITPDGPNLERIKEALKHDRVRVIRPGDAVTQDLRSDRLNVEIGSDGEIAAFRCG